VVDLTYENQGTNTFLVCKLGLEDVIDTMSMGMISNNKILGVMPFSYSQNDNERFFKYNIWLTSNTNGNSTKWQR